MEMPEEPAGPGPDLPSLPAAVRVAAGYGRVGAMAIHIYMLGSPRVPGEGLRIGTVRHLPRGVPKSEYAGRDFFDVWLPNLAPSAELFRWVRSEALDEKRFRQFARRYRAEMKEPDVRHVIDLLAALSYHADLSVGCYCEDERRCHRSVLRELLREAGASMAEG
jgi:uncharacterized protein YeaO (DUF488 family)